MSEKHPRVSIGLPVYNGERYLEARLDSLLGQTFQDLEIIVSDNCSTDRTADICRERAASDPRLKYHRNKQNIGGFPNHDLVFHLSRGEYFMWTGADDLHDPMFVARCVEVLDSRPEVVICYSATMYIDDLGNEVPGKEKYLHIDNPVPARRFAEMIRLDHVIEPVMGLMRRSIAARTHLLSTYPDSDRVMIAEMALIGPFHRIPEVLFYRRSGELNSTAVFPGRHERMRWIDPLHPRVFVFPYNRQVLEILRSIRRSTVSPGQKLRCLSFLIQWCSRHHRLIASDYKIALRDILRPLVRPLLRKKAAGC